MKKIGMIFQDEVALNAAFFMKAYSVLEYGEKAEVKRFERTITYPEQDVQWMFVLIRDHKDVIKISGVQFDSIFSEVVDLQAKQYIMTRYRPGLN